MTLLCPNGKEHFVPFSPCSIPTRNSFTERSSWCSVCRGDVLSVDDDDDAVITRTGAGGGGWRRGARGGFKIWGEGGSDRRPRYNFPPLWTCTQDRSDWFRLEPTGPVSPACLVCLPLSLDHPKEEEGSVRVITFVVGLLQSVMKCRPANGESVKASYQCHPSEHDSYGEYRIKRRH